MNSKYAIALNQHTNRSRPMFDALFTDFFYNVHAIFLLAIIITSFYIVCRSPLNIWNSVLFPVCHLSVIVYVIYFVNI